jgi:signal transduction histidine kinase/CheY-like chemotaxis protein/HAMP domain-containing protein
MTDAAAAERPPSKGSSPPAFDTLDEDLLLRVLSDVGRGDFSVRMPVVWTGVAGKIADTLNDIVAANQSLGVELARVSRVVGREGRLSARVASQGSDSVWAECVDSVNNLIDDLVRPTSDMQRVIGAVAGGDLSKKITTDAHGDVLELKTTINAMVDQLTGFVSEVTRVIRDVGTEGKLGQAAAVTIEVGGVWKDLTDNVNIMADNLTGQVRDIAEVTTAVANGDLTKKISADVKGEFLELKNTVNAMVDQLNRFASEVTRVAREVGVEGKLGGQAQSEEVAGVWKDLTDNVNQLAANLTNQVRAIADVATAVTEGDLTRQVGVDARGEVAVLKDKLNEMIRNLRETTRQNTEQDWLKTNLERFARMLQGQRDLATVSSMILAELTPLVSAQHGVFYTLASLGDGGEPALVFQAGYGYNERKHVVNHFRLGEGLVGQCAKEKERILLTNVPGDYIKINSGLGEASPLNIIVLPILFEGSVRAVVELASFNPFSPTHQAFLDQLTETIGLVLNTIEANTLTENLLKQAQSQAQELQARQEQLRSSNDDLGTQAARLAEQNIEVERKNQEVELAKRLVEEKAEQLAASSKYKSEFFSNMSHELRTPLNSLLILAGELEANSEENLTTTQVQYASVIRSSGNDLLRLLNDILDLAKVESGTVNLEVGELSMAALRDAIKNDFDQVAEKQNIEFSVELADDLPAAITTDAGRLRQVLKNLLANAFKFTEHGTVSLKVRRAEAGWTSKGSELIPARAMIALAVVDTGIGIAAEVQERIFDAFAQADGTTARQYGGTGLGLSISLELVRLLGGEITLQSASGEGSTFTVYLPVTLELDRAAKRMAPVESAIAAAYPPQTAAPPVMPGSDDIALQPVSAGSVALPALSPLTPPSSSAGVALAGCKALIVDDDSRNIFALTALLRAVQIEVIRADSGEEALAILAQAPECDIVLVDIMMPGMDGYQTLRAMRKMLGDTALPLVAFTAKVGAGERQRCLDAGASDYIPKPVGTSELLATLGKWISAAANGEPRALRRSGAAAPAEEIVEEPAPALSLGSPNGGAATVLQPLKPPSDPAGAQLAGRRVLIVDDDFINIFALTALLERISLRVVSAESGSEALAMLTRSPEIEIVLVDITMPEMDGYQTLRAMRGMLGDTRLPLVAVTAKVEAGERQLCLDAGASDYAPTPVDTTDLIAILGKWLSITAGATADPAA